jgi:hypothetical protein
MFEEIRALQQQCGPTRGMLNENEPPVDEFVESREI